MASKVCPECGAPAHRSHTRGLKERLIRAVSSYKAYRCHECGWRGWFGKSREILSKNRLRTIVALLLTLLITTLLVSFLIENLTVPETPVQKRKHTP